MKYLFIVLISLLSACNEPNKNAKPEQSMDDFKKEMKKDSMDLVQVMKQIEWATEMKILLLRQGIKGEKANRHIDSLEKQMFNGVYPSWYDKYKKATSDK